MSQQDLAHLRPEPHSDEIDLGELIRNLLAQWKLICGITFLGAVMGVAIALALPKEYRVEAVFEKPSTKHIQPLLAQNLIPLSRQTILGGFLKNLQSRELIEQALEAHNALVDDKGEPLTAEQRFTIVSNIANSIRIAPATYDFIEEIKGLEAEFDEISFSILSSNPSQTALWMNELLTLASNKTTADFANDINGQRNIEIALLQTELNELKGTAIAEREQKIEHLKAALAIATELNIQEPTSWSALVHGNGNVQLLNEQPQKEEDFLKGTRVLKAELSVLQNSPIMLGDLQKVTAEVDKRTITTISPNTIKGQIATLEGFALDTANIAYVQPSVQALVPATAEKPNRKLIAIAATVLAGFFGLFIALIRLAIRKD
ncbi:Wzz/FepE/Etk N-terminal domain-containing protein [Reinekea marina]|uniref:Wzz/FepE/Etk N-terminal domain-containing protein n=1 Tax=Reinekea marina TaxID=1310421 RepID=A0ABV7WUG7_9GAMM|nr:Wzz/FepE/Etk N-terminal domain-containing protein [Reinekea marina]MDN3649330.1 Wzz/FepE/Etk N-terminal domain-containing protein [Reinekea marina]